MTRLGIRYARSLGVQRNYSVALKWFRLSAIGGHSPAMINLATMYQIGAGGHRDYRRAYAWLLVAAVLGTPDQIHDAAIFKLGMIASSIRPTTAARAQHLANDIAGTLGRRCDMPTHRYLGWEFTPSG
jgi:TPR repeat protein